MDVKLIRAMKMDQISKPTAETLERKTPITATIPNDAASLPKLFLRNITTEISKESTAGRTSFTAEVIPFENSRKASQRPSSKQRGRRWWPVI
jgi:hypothetical protein